MENDLREIYSYWLDVIKYFWRFFPGNDSFFTKISVVNEPRRHDSRQIQVSKTKIDTRVADTLVDFSPKTSAPSLSRNFPLFFIPFPRNSGISTFHETSMELHETSRCFAFQNRSRFRQKYSLVFTGRKTFHLQSISQVTRNSYLRLQTLVKLQYFLLKNTSRFYMLTLN